MSIVQARVPVVWRPQPRQAEFMSRPEPEALYGLSLIHISNFFSGTNMINLFKNVSIRYIIALGISGCLITTGNDLSAGRLAGFAACLACIFAQTEGASGKFYPNMPTLSTPVVLSLIHILSVADNISIASLDALRKGPIMLDNKKILDLVATNKEKMAIKVPSPKTQIKSLSGGNQQKVLIARWLANNPDVLILDEPTRGIDVGAKYEIYCIIADLAKQGKSIIMISSEMSEIIGMSNRVMVMCDGRITGFIDGKDATQENIMALATQFETAPDAAAANQ